MLKSQPPALVSAHRIGVDPETNLAECQAQAERQPMRHPHPKLPAGTERRTQVAAFVETCMAVKGDTGNGRTVRP